VANHTPFLSRKYGSGQKNNSGNSGYQAKSFHQSNLISVLALCPAFVFQNTVQYEKSD
jgi:hypothetical protein